LGHRGAAHVAARTQSRSSKGGPRDTQQPPGGTLREASAGRPPDSRAATYAVLDAVARSDDDGDALDDLVARAQRGDEIAFADLYVRLFERVHRYLHIAVKSNEDAHEIAQDLFAKLLIQLRTFDPARGDFRPWLFSLARRMALDHLRRARRSDTLAPDEIARYLPRTTDRERALRERFDPTLDVAAIVDALPAAQRRVVVLRFAFDFTPTEIAEIVGVTPDAIRHTQHRALKTIATALAEERRRAA
jgi:RNA polymerase sigma-70 factor (ECF subfamily)